MFKCVLVLMCDFVTSSVYSQKTAIQIENERWQRERNNSESHWKNARVKDLLEQKLDLSKISKVETQKWIIEKLNAYSKVKYTTKGMGYWDPITNGTKYMYHDYEVLSKEIYFSDKYLVLKFNYKEISSGSKPEYTKRVDSVYIPHLDGINYDYSELYLTMFDKAFFSLPVNFDRETEIGFRMKKALVHLCSFYWKEVTNEAF